MLKYLFLIVLGIIIYIVLNNWETFSIGALPGEFYLVTFGNRNSDTIKYEFIEYNGTGELRDNNRDFLNRLFPADLRRDDEGNALCPLAIYGMDALDIPSLMHDPPNIIPREEYHTEMDPNLFFNFARPSGYVRGCDREGLRQTMINNLLRWLNSEQTLWFRPNGFTREQLRDILVRYKRQDETRMYNAIIQVLNLFDEFGYVRPEPYPPGHPFADFGGGGGGEAAPAPRGGEAAPAPGGGEAAPAPGGEATGLPGDELTAEPAPAPEPVPEGVSRPVSPLRKCAARSI